MLTPKFLVSKLDPGLPEPQVTVTCENAGHLASLADGSQTLVCIDPPYYDNVMYAELSDFFYVWEKRTSGCTVARVCLPTAYQQARRGGHQPGPLLSRWTASQRAGRSRLHRQDGRHLCTECRRVLADDGVLTVMFTHKRADAWDSLGTALITSGIHHRNILAGPYRERTVAPSGPPELGQVHLVHGVPQAQ